MSLVLLVSPAMAEETTDVSWHQFHKDVEHTGYQVDGPDTNNIAWTTGPIHAIKDSSVVIAEGKAFVNCYQYVGPDGYSWIKAVDITDGSLVWSTELDSMEYGSWSSPAYHNGYVFTSSGRNTSCIDAATGNIEWTFVNPPVEGVIAASVNGGPTIADGKVFCSDWDGGHYYCLNEADGTQLWNFSVYDSGGTGLNGPRAQGCVAYMDGKAYLTSFSYQHVENGSLAQGFVYCVDAETGTEKWKTSMEQNGCGSVACGDDGRVYVSSYNFYGNGATYALDANDGSIIWERETWRTDGTPALAYGNVYVAGGYEWGKVYCFNATTGNTVWETDGSLWIGHWTESVAVADGKVYVGRGAAPSGSEMTSGYDTLYALDALTGEMRWIAPYGGSSPAIYNGKLFTIHNDKSLYCYDGGNAVNDLTPTSLDLATLEAYVDIPNEFTATIENQGTTYITDVKVSLLDDGVEISSQTIDVAAGWSEDVTFVWTPTVAEAGTHTISISVDPQDSIVENNEANNIISESIYVMDGGCDLQPISLTPSEIYVNQVYDMTATVNNIGYKYSVPCTVTVKEGSTIIGDVTLPAVAPGTSEDVSFTWTPSTTGDSSLTVTVDTDYGNEELSESNNALDVSVSVMPETTIETLAVDDWAQFQNGWNNLGETGSYAPIEDSAALKWSVDLSGERVDCPPVVVGDVVYTFTSNGSLYAYNKNDGTYLWKKGLDPAVIQSSTPAYGDGNIFVASKSGSLSAYNADTGVEQWTIDVAGDCFESPITYYDHRIYIGDGLGQGVGTKYFHCYDDLGNHLWSHPNADCGGFLWNGAAVVGDYVVYSTHEGKLVCLDRKVGTLVDEVNLDSDLDTRISFANETPGLFRSSVVYEDGYVYTTSEQGQAMGFLWKVGFDSSTGQILNDGWSLMQGFSTSTPVVYNGRVYVGQGEHGYTGKLNCVDDSTGQLIWSYDVPDGVKSSPAVSTYYDKPFIYFTSAMEDGSLYCIDENGMLIWEYNPPGDNSYVLQGAAVSQGKVYYGTNAGVYCIESEWNPFNDELSESGAVISNSEIQYAVFKWKKQTLLPSTGYVISNSNIQLLVFKWKKQTPM
ncbi:PQQ-binding-like beta-propeller repeat protein [Methanococcoides sp. AM1]|uniref:outer membrane protein assembly factor BamB family protein n=1 Tax=Methanococcoides sp. AM1 TaxID=1201011 RepID=UPI0014386B3B|nr:PQQ-binding-like beta-propeller repeat protein [Methanococcoides sp. AM1]